MIKSSLMIVMGIVALALLGCQGEVSQECAAPDPLCETTEAESSEPCEEGEVNCRRVEIEHCGGPWVVHCRENGGSGGAGVDDDEEDGSDAPLPKAGWWDSTDFSFEIDECNLTNVFGLRPGNDKVFLLSHTPDGFNTSRQTGEPASFTPDGPIFVSSVSWLLDCREGCRLFGSQNEAILDLTWELRTDVTMTLLSEESAEMSEQTFGFCAGADCVEWRETLGIPSEPCESAHSYVANWAEPNDDGGADASGDDDG